MDENKARNVIELNGESCSWCARREDCPYHKENMENVRKDASHINKTVKAYFSIRVNCDYYNQDGKAYEEFNPGEMTVNK